MSNFVNASCLFHSIDVIESVDINFFMRSFVRRESNRQYDTLYPILLMFGRNVYRLNNHQSNTYFNPIPETRICFTNPN